MGKMCLWVGSFPVFGVFFFGPVQHGLPWQHRNNSWAEAVLGPAMPASLICSMSSLILETYRVYFLHAQEDIPRFLVTDFQSHTLWCHHKHRFTWFAAAFMQPITFSAESSKVDALPNFPVSSPSLQPGMCRVLSSCCQGQGKHWPNTWKLRNLPTEKIISFVSIITIKAFFLFRILFYTRILIRIGFIRCIYRHSVTGSKTLFI